MDFFSRLADQARDLWARPVGKWIVGVLSLFIVGLMASSFLLTRPAYVALGTFGAQDASKVATKLNESRIKYQQSGTTGFTFMVLDGEYNTARLLLAELELDPTSAVWAADSWSNRADWSNTDLDKRILQVEKTEVNLSRAIMAMSVIENARVQVSVPMEQKLFASMEVAPKAFVMIQPRRDEKLPAGMVRAIAETVAAGVPGLDPKNVTIVDVTTNLMVSQDIFAVKDPAVVQAEQRMDLLNVQQQFQEHWQNNLTRQLERVVGPGNASVIVNPVINWERVTEEAVRYQGAGPNGIGIPLSSQTQKQTSEGTSAAGDTTPAGVSSNSEATAPIYPGTTPTGSGNISSDQSNVVINYLVDQIKTTTDKPGGIYEEIAVGVFLNQTRVVTPEQQAAMSRVVTSAMGSKASVVVEAFPFADDIAKMFDADRPSPVSPAAPDWLYWLLGAALGLGGVGLFFIATRPRRPILEPVFAGPEAAMMGGIPVTKWDMPINAQAATVDLPEPTSFTESRRPPETAEDVMSLPPEDLAKLTDEDLLRMGVDPATVRMKERVVKIAKVEPDAVANLLRTWMSQE